ncbi:hypothetical protein KJ586_02990 [Patescibacteria group bacterium]|nr:hypothetical protein [Patescibacteria group bacterium]MBU4455449.1 hypothetical protein [Patescibacteria group bacterium]MCG2690710.1 hypothetical protein [Candidatus Parcubacteria bacterium]MDP3043479.1 hypothetical protein [bacterium]
MSFMEFLKNLFGKKEETEQQPPAEQPEQPEQPTVEPMEQPEQPAEEEKTQQ